MRAREWLRAFIFLGKGEPGGGQVSARSPSNRSPGVGRPHVSGLRSVLTGMKDLCYQSDTDWSVRIVAHTILAPTVLRGRCHRARAGEQHACLSPATLAPAR